MEITLSRVIDAARQRRAAVTAEAAGYVALLVLQQVAGRPCPVTADLVLLTAAGEVRIEPGPVVSARDVEVELRRLLAALLALSQSAPPALHAAGERGAVGDLAALESELLAALIPLNHAAAGRALARLYRETLRAPRPALANDDEAPGSSSVAASQRTPSPVAAAVRTPSPVAAAVRTPSPLAPALRASWPAEVVLSTPSPAAAFVRTPSPVAAAVRTPAPATTPLRAQAELEIDVDLDVEVVLAAPEPDLAPQVLTPPPSVGQVSSPVSQRLEEEYSPTFATTSAEPDEDLEPSAQRSDLRELLNGFLAHTRCEERMAADLRRMIGLEPGRGAPAHGATLGR